MNYTRDEWTRGHEFVVQSLVLLGPPAVVREGEARTYIPGSRYGEHGEIAWSIRVLAARLAI